MKCCGSFKSTGPEQTIIHTHTARQRTIEIPMMRAHTAGIDITSTACVNKSASLKEHFFLGKLYVSFEKVYNNMKGNIISFYRIFLLCNLDVWIRNYGKSCEVPPNLFWSDSLIHVLLHLPLVTTWVSVLKTNNSEQHKNFLTKVAVIIHVLIQFYMSAFDVR